MRYLSPGLLAVAVLLGMTFLPARAVTLPVSQDASTLAGKIAGKTTTVSVANNSTGKVTSEGFLQFNLSTLPADITADTVVAARLKLYTAAAAAPGSVSLHLVTTPWVEAPAAALPTVSPTVVTTIPAASLVSKSFVLVDVTDTVRAWLAGTTTNHGLALLGTAGRTVFGAKEGPGLGPSAELEILTDFATVEMISGANLTPGSVTAASLDSGIGIFGINGNSLTTPGSVSIGSTNEASVALEVNGGVRARGGEPGTFGSSNNGYAFDGTGDTDSGMFSTANGLLQFYTDAAERVRIQSNGFVGIGTTSPDSMLTVNGPIHVTGLSRQGTGSTRGMVTRQINATIGVSGTIVAQTSQLQLTRDGTSGGLVMHNITTGSSSLAFIATTSTGTVKAGYHNFTGDAVNSTFQVIADADDVVFLQLSFGDVYDGIDQTVVTLQRTKNDNFFLGFLNSTVNQ